MRESHSKLGIVSMLLAIGTWIYFAVTSVLFTNTNIFTYIFDKLFSSGGSGMVKGFGDFGTAIFLIIVLFIVIPVLAHLIGTTLGIIAVFSKSRKRLFGIIGICLNILPMVLLSVLFIIGLLAGS